MQATDDRTLVWKMKAPYPDFMQALAFWYVMLHPKAKVEADKDYFDHPVIAGPYIIKQSTPGTPTMVLEPNPKYVGGDMMIKQLELVTVTDLTQRVLQLSSGAIDWAFELPFSAGPTLPKDVTPLPHPQGGTFHLTINLEKKGPLQDVNVRRAISLAIDREAVNQKAFFGVSPRSCRCSTLASPSRSRCCRMTASATWRQPRSCWPGAVRQWLRVRAAHLERAARLERGDASYRREPEGDWRHRQHRGGRRRGHHGPRQGPDV